MPTIVCKKTTLGDSSIRRTHAELLQEPESLNCKLDGTVDPGVSNDDSEDYAVGSHWYNATGDRLFVCTDASTGAAVWKRIDLNVVNTVATTNDTVTTLATIPIPDDTVVLIEAKILGRRTAVAADRAVYIRRAVVFREAAGGATMVSDVDTPLTRESDEDWDATIDTDGNNARIRVTGKTDRAINWKSLYTVKEVS